MPPPICRYYIKINKNARLADLLKKVSESVGLPESSIMLAEINHNKIYRRITGDPKAFISYIYAIHNFILELLVF